MNAMSYETPEACQFISRARVAVKDQGRTVLMAAKVRVIGLTERGAGAMADRAVANKGGDGAASE